MKVDIRDALREWKYAGHAIATSLLTAGSDPDTPKWWGRFCEFTCHLIDTVLSLLALEVPLVLKVWCMPVVDRWHQELEHAPAPYGWTSFRQWLRTNPEDGANDMSITMRQK